MTTRFAAIVPAAFLLMSAGTLTGANGQGADCGRHFRQ